MQHLQHSISKACNWTTLTTLRQSVHEKHINKPNAEIKEIIRNNPSICVNGGNIT